MFHFDNQFNGFLTRPLAVGLCRRLSSATVRHFHIFRIGACRILLSSCRLFPPVFDYPYRVEPESGAHGGANPSSKERVPCNGDKVRL